MTEPIQVSNSEVQTWKSCRRKWYLSYYACLGPRREEKHGPRALGTRVHTCLEAYYVQQLPGALPPDFVDPIALHDDLVRLDLMEYPEQAEQITKDAQLSRIMLEGYFEWLEESGSDAGMEIIAAEEEVRHEVTLPTGTPVIIRGKLDLRARQEHDDSVVFLDHKTVGDFTTPTKTIHLDEQLPMYELLLKLTHPGEKIDGGVYNMIRKVKRSQQAKPPFYMRFEIRHSREEIQTFYLRLMEALEDIEIMRHRLDEGADPNVVCYPTPTRDCSWKCDFYHVCPLMNRPSDKPEQFLEVAFQKIDPYARYKASESVVE